MDITTTQEQADRIDSPTAMFGQWTVLSPLAYELRTAALQTGSLKHVYPKTRTEFVQLLKHYRMTLGDYYVSFTRACGWFDCYEEYHYLEVMHTLWCKIREVLARRHGVVVVFPVCAIFDSDAVRLQWRRMNIGIILNRTR